MQKLYWSNVSKIGKGKNMFQQYKIRSVDTIHVINTMFQQVIGKHISLTLRANQLTFLNQQIRPIFNGKVVKVTNGYITLDSVTLSLPNQLDYTFQTPLHFPIERISNFTPEEE
jgi:hypothetical protein